MKKVLLLFGGNSSEHEISCMSAKSILENIDKNSFKVTSAGISLKNEWYIFNDDLKHLCNKNWIKKKVKRIDNIINFLENFDVIFPIIHGTNGEDGRLQGFFDLFKIKYVGSGTLASAVGMDKEFSKIVFESAGIPQVPFIVINENKYDVSDIENKISYPAIIKPANGGSSIGISKAKNKKELVQGIKLAKRYDNKVIIEKFLKIRELECAVLSGKDIIVSQIGEIIPSNDFYDYNAKYENASKTVAPAILKKNITLKIQEYAKKAFISINAKNLSRVDFFYDEDNDNIYLNEINTIPGFTTISMYPKLLINDDFSYSDLISFLINNA